MIAAVRSTGGGASGSTRPNQQSHLLHKERSLICIWKSTARSDDELIQSLLSAVSSQQNPNGDFAAFAGSAHIIDRWNAKTTVILSGRRAHRAALHLIELPRGNAAHPWSNVSEHNRDWLCPRTSCVDCRPNIGAVPMCRHCGEGRPTNLRESMQIWVKQTRHIADAVEANGGGDVGGGTSTGQSGAASAGSADDSSSAPIPARMPDGPAPKRARLANAEGSSATDNSMGTSSHPSADEAKTRLTVWNCPDHWSDEQLIECLKSMTERANFAGDVSIVDRFYAGKCIVVLTGAHAHRAALTLSMLPNGPQLTGPNQYPWRNIGEHHREWYCPRLSCVGLETDRPNVDESNGTNRASARCRGCGGARPQSLLHAAQLWEQDLVDSLEEARQKADEDIETENMDASLFDTLIDEYESSLITNTVEATDLKTSSAGSRAVANSQNAATSTTSAPIRSSVGERDSAAAGSARPVTPSNNSLAAPPSRKLTGSKAEFAIWNSARLAAGMDRPLASDGLLSSSKFFLNRTKDDLINLLPSLPHRRIWAFDTNPKNGAKGWMWTDCIDTFVDVYLQIDAKQRHAYEVVQQNVPCRAAFDLDMYTGDGVNGDKDDKRMAGAIIEETHRIIEENWTNGSKPQFKDEVLVAHGPTKKSYHIIIKSYDSDGKEVLLKDFTTCKILANAVNDTLGDAIMVDRKPGHGGKTNPEPASFIDLAIYTKDRPFRLIFSSKITSPDRLFVDAMKRQFSFGDERDDKTTVIDTLIVPHNAAEMPTIEIKVAGDEDEFDAAHSINLGQGYPSSDREGGFASRIGGVVNSWLSWGSKKADQEETIEARDPPLRASRPTTTLEGFGPDANCDEDEYPLLDFGKEVVARKSLSHDIPHPFKGLIPWVEKLAADLPGAMKAGRAICSARYEYSEKEAYVHFTLNRSYASYCHCIGRPHSEQNIMISIDLFDGIAYQRCWDRSCKDSDTRGSAKHILSCRPPAGAMPTRADLEKFDAQGGLNLV